MTSVSYWIELGRPCRGLGVIVPTAPAVGWLRSPLPRLFISIRRFPRRPPWADYGRPCRGLGVIGCHCPHGSRRGLITVAAAAAWRRPCRCFWETMCHGSHGSRRGLITDAAAAARSYGDLIVRPPSQAARALPAATCRFQAHPDIGFRRVKPALPFRCHVVAQRLPRLRIPAIGSRSAGERGFDRSPGAPGSRYGLRRPRGATLRRSKTFAVQMGPRQESLR